MAWAVYHAACDEGKGVFELTGSQTLFRIFYTFLYGKAKASFMFYSMRGVFSIFSNRKGRVYDENRIGYLCKQGL